MRAANHNVLEKTYEWLKEGKACWLSTVVATYGSSPRPEGSLMVCDASQHVVGSLSGGCVEEDLVEKLINGELDGRPAQFFRYGESDEDAEKFGLPCGGHLDVVVQALIPQKETLAQFEDIHDVLLERKLLIRSLNVTTGHSEVAETSEALKCRYDYDRGQLTHTLGPTHQIFIVGAGMVGQYVAEFAKTLEFNVTVCDPRPEAIESLDVSGITKIQDMPDDAIRKYANDNQSAIVALTHDPRIDDMGLLEAFETEAFYIGAMGSSRTSAKRRERLIQLGVSNESLNRLHAPIGLSIGSKTPPEIAMAVMAEIVSVKNALTKQAREEALLQVAAS